MGTLVILEVLAVFIKTKKYCIVCDLLYNAWLLKGPLVQSAKACESHQSMGCLEFVWAQALCLVMD